MITGELIWGKEFLDELAQPTTDQEILTMEKEMSVLSIEFYSQMFKPKTFAYNQRWLPKHYCHNPVR